MMQFLTAELAKEEGLKSLDNDVVYRLCQKLMSLLEQEEVINQSRGEWPFAPTRLGGGGQVSVPLRGSD